MPPLCGSFCLHESTYNDAYLYGHTLVRPPRERVSSSTKLMVSGRAGPRQGAPELSRNTSCRVTKRRISLLAIDQQGFTQFESMVFSDRYPDVHFASPNAPPLRSK